MAQTSIRWPKLSLGEDLLIAQAKGVAAGISNQPNRRVGTGTRRLFGLGDCIIVSEARKRSQAGCMIGP
jgi:hypothetical protein